MGKFGLSTIPTDYSIQPIELGRWLEAHGFESVWFGEHSHIPISRQTAFVAGGELPEYYKHFFDPFIALTAVAAVTTDLKVGTGVCLPPLHHPAQLAKTISCLDQVANGRVLMGVGAGWNAEELADFGVAYEDRWKVTREDVLAMREIWTKDEPEFHGRFVNFDPLWSWPKPVQPKGPPVLMGAWSQYVPDRIAEYCDGWLPVDIGHDDFPEKLALIREAMDRAGRSFADLDLTILSNESLAHDDRLEASVLRLFEFGFGRVLLRLAGDKPEVQWPLLERYAKLVAKLS